MTTTKPREARLLIGEKFHFMAGSKPVIPGNVQRRRQDSPGGNQVADMFNTLRLGPQAGHALEAKRSELDTGHADGLPKAGQAGHADKSRLNADLPKQNKIKACKKKIEDALRRGFASFADKRKVWANDTLCLLTREAAEALGNQGRVNLVNDALRPC